MNQGPFSMLWGNGVQRRGSYVPGQGTFENPAHIYRNDLGQKVVQSSGLIRRNDGSVHEAYDIAPGTGIGNIVAKVSKGIPLSPNEQFTYRQYLMKRGINVRGGFGLATNALVSRSQSGLMGTPQGNSFANLKNPNPFNPTHTIR